MDLPIQTHWDVRGAIVEMHRSAVGHDKPLLVGDSLTEGFYWNKVGDCTIVNAGFGGITVANLLPKLSQVMADRFPPSVVLLIGTNDALKLTDEKIDAFRVNYSKVVDLFADHGTAVSVVTIPPVEPGKFKRTSRDPEAIKTLNAVIVDEIAKPRNLPVIDLYSKLTVNGVAIDGATTDGIHFSRASYLAMYAAYDEAFKAGNLCE